MKLLKASALGAALLLLGGCASMFGPSKGQRTAWVNAHPNIPARYGQAIENGEIMIGMTEDEVRAAWGDPCGWCYGTSHNSWGDTWEYNIFGTGSEGAGSRLPRLIAERDRVGRCDVQAPFDRESAARAA